MISTRVLLVLLGAFVSLGLAHCPTSDKTCGNLICDKYEMHSTRSLCRRDCYCKQDKIKFICGDGQCDPCENECTCPWDCSESSSSSSSSSRSSSYFDARILEEEDAGAVANTVAVTAASYFAAGDAEDGTEESYYGAAATTTAAEEVEVETEVPTQSPYFDSYFAGREADIEERSVAVDPTPVEEPAVDPTPVDDPALELSESTRLGLNALEEFVNDVRTQKHNFPQSMEDELVDLALARMHDFEQHVAMHEARQSKNQLVREKLMAAAAALSLEEERALEAEAMALLNADE